MATQDVASALEKLAVCQVEYEDIVDELKDIEAGYADDLQKMYRSRDARAREAEKNLKDFWIRG